MRALDRKLLRDLSGLRGQVLTIALVVAAGIASFVCVQSTFTSLLRSRDAYYERARFGDVFVRMERAPMRVARQLEDIDGVASVYARVARPVLLPVPFLLEPATGLVVSLPEHGPPPLNDVVLRAGRMPAAESDDEALLLEAFATKHEVHTGDALPVIIEGRLRQMRVVGIAMSPEFVFATAGDVSFDGSMAVLYVPHPAAAAAFRMEGAFNDAVLRLSPGASEAAVLLDVDRLLANYGASGAVPRSLQSSNYVLEGELAQLKGLATFVPFIFLGVAAFLVNIVLSRLVLLQRGQIAALKALGYSGLSIGAHYLKLVSIVVAVGALIGVPVGAWLGSEFTEMYTDFFRFPLRAYSLGADVVAIAVLVSLVTGLGGAALTVRGVIALPPAEAMRPPAPPSYTRGPVSATLGRLFETSGRMVFRDLERRPLRTLLSALGIAMGIAILVVGRFSTDAFEFLVGEQFERAMREDLAVMFLRPTDASASRVLAAMPGVTRVEGMRSVAVRFRAGARHRDGVIQGYEEGMTLRSLIDARAQVVPIPTEGVMLTSKLAEILGVGVGDTIELDVLEGQRITRTVPVAALVDEMYGLFGHTSAPYLNRLLGEDRMITSVLVKVDPERLDEARRRLTEMKGIAGVIRREGLIEQFREQSGQSTGAITAILTMFAAVIAIGVVYNNARVALSTRSRDLASLRVLGFTRGEIATVLLGELSIQVLIAVPFGLAIGTWLATVVMSNVDAERYRLPVIISARTYAFAVLVAVVASIVSAFLVRRRLDRLDLIGVLKTRE